MVVPVLPQIARDLQLRSEAATQMVMSLTVLGWSLGPLLLAPLSEQYGRAPVLNYAQLLFLVVNTMSAFEWNGTRFLVLRFFAGFIGSAPVSVSLRYTNRCIVSRCLLLHTAKHFVSCNVVGNVEANSVAIDWKRNGKRHV